MNAACAVEEVCTTSASGRCSAHQRRVCAAACGCVATRRTSSGRTPCGASRLNAIGTVISRVIISGSPVASSSRVTGTEPSTEFSIGTTAPSASPSRTASSATRHRRARLQVGLRGGGQRAQRLLGEGPLGAEVGVAGGRDSGHARGAYRLRRGMTDDGITALGDYARLDTDRAARTGDPEVVYGAGKTPQQVVEILRTLHDAHPDRAVLATRLTDEARRRRARGRCPTRSSTRSPGPSTLGPAARRPRHGHRGLRRHLRRPGRRRGRPDRPGLRRRGRRGHRRRRRRAAPGARRARRAARGRLPGRGRRHGGRAAQRGRRAGRRAAGRRAHQRRLRRVLRRARRAARDAQLLRARASPSSTSTTASAPASSPPGWPATPRRGPAT